MLGAVLCSVVSDPGADITASTGQNADANAENGRIKNGGDQFLKLFPGGKYTTGGFADLIFRLAGSGASFGELTKHLRDRKQTNQRRNSGDTTEQSCRTEGKTREC